MLKMPKYVYFLFIMFVLITIDTTIILDHDSQTPTDDITDNYMRSLHFYEMISNGELMSFGKELLFEYHSIKPPFIFLQTIPFFLLFGKTLDVATLSHSIHVFITLFAIYFLGCKLKNEKVGLLAAILTVFMPGFLIFSRVYMQSIAVVSMVVLSVTLYEYSNYLKNKTYRIWFGIVVGLGLLTKIIYPLIMFTFFLPRINDIQKIKLKNMIIVIVIILLIALPFFAQKITLQSERFSHINSKVNEPMSNLVEYFFSLQDTLLKLFLIPAIIVIIYSLIKKENMNIVLGILLCLFIFLFFQVKSKYIIVILPFIALLLAINIIKVKVPFVLLVVLILLFGTTYELYQREQYVYNGPDDLRLGLRTAYDDGGHFQDKLVELYNTINSSKVLILSSSELSYALYTKLSYENREVYNTIHCVSVIYNDDLYDACSLPRPIPNDFACSFEQIVYENNTKFVEGERKEIIEQVLDSWHRCKENFTKVYDKEIQIYNLNKA